MDPSDGLAAGGGGGPPDENYIERLFPRCQPKQQQAAGHRRQLGGSLNRSNGRQQQQHHHHHHQRQQQQQIIQLQHQQPQPPPNKTKRRNRLKIQQHSRRELEARRNRIRANEDTDNTQRQHSTDSSDTEQLANGKRVGLRKSISANDQYQMNNNNSQRLLTAELMPATTSSVLPPTATINTPATIANRGGVKKTSKYTASQNLQQQLQRSSQSGQTPTAPIVSKTSDTTSSTTIDELTNNNNNKNSRDTDCTDSSRSATSATQLQSHASNQRSILKPQPDIRLGLVRDHERRGGTCRTSRGVVFGNQIDKMEAQANCTTQSPPPQPLTQPPSTVDEVGAAAPNSSSVADSNATIANTADLATQNKTIALKTDDADDKLLIEPATSEHVRTSNIDTKRGEQIEKEKNILDNQKDEDKYINLFVYDKAPLGYQTTKGAVELPQPEKTTKSGSSNSTDIKSSIESQQIEPTDQIIPDEGRAQQLLYSANRRHLLVDDDEEENTIKNDASIEELCSVNDSSDDTRKFLHNRVSKKTAGGDESACSRKSNLEPTAPSSVTTVTITTSNRNNHASHHRSSLGTTLQPVDEKAELNIDESLCSDNVENQQQITDKSELMTSIGDESAMHTTNNYNGQKKICVPPGFPQRVKPQVCVAPSSINHENTTRLSSPPSSPSPPSPPQAPNMNEPIVETNYRHLQASDDLIKKISKPERALDTQSDRQSVDACLINRNDLNYSTPFKVVGSENSDELISTNEAPLSPAIRFPSKRTEELHLPIISEGISELELDRKEQDADAELTGGLEKMSLTNRTVQQNQDFLNGTISEAPNTTSTMQPPPQQQQTTQLTREAPASKDMNEFNISKSTGFSQQSEQLTIDGNNFFNDSTPTTSLRHHRLPNETCHYSVMRSTTSNILNTPSPSTISSAPPRSSSLQFNTLSDGDSGSDDRPTIRHQIQNTSATTPSSTISPATTMKKPDYRSAGAMNSAQASSSSSKFDDDLVTPTTKTALIFPRLDEGLSSEAESCEDEVEDDDERAMEADVDADDDEDEEDDEDLDDDGDIKGPMESIVRGTQASQSTEDSFIRQQHTLKPQNRLINSLQQQQQQFSANSLANPTDTDLYQNKAPNYAGFIGHEASDQTSDIKSPNVYPSQNGQSNYWVGLSNQQQQQQQLSGAGTAPSSQLHPPYQQFAIPRNHQNVNTNHSSVSVPRATGSAFNREEAKVANRLSSDTDNETDRLLAPQRVDQLQKIPGTDMSSNNSANEVQHINSYSRQSANSREGSTHTDCEDRQHLSEKERQIRQAEDAVRDVKLFRNGESQVATEVQLFVSTEKIIVLDDKHRKIVMDHSLRTISYIADIGDAIVLIVKKKNASVDTTHELARPISKTSCHVFESNESSTITKSISQAFQVAYAELLKANGAGDASNYLPKEVDYQEVLNSQEMSTAELEMFARKDNQREVIVPKEANEILGLSIVESGWGSVLPTAVIASLKQDGPAYRCKKLSVGDQILSINGISLVGLSLPECQEILRKTKRQRVARLSVVPCPITVEVKIKRPDTKYQLGFSVQNGVICSLLRGGIAERGGVRVGHRIMSINGTTVVGVPHDKIVTLLASSIGEIRMKTCLTSLYRHMLGEEKAVFL